MEEKTNPPKIDDSKKYIQSLMANSDEKETEKNIAQLQQTVNVLEEECDELQIKMDDFVSDKNYVGGGHVQQLLTPKRQQLMFAKNELETATKESPHHQDASATFVFNWICVLCTFFEK